MMERVAQRVRDGGDPRIELFARGGVAGAEALINAVRAHRAPFVMIAGEPDFREIRECVIVENLFGRKVAVVVVDRLVLREIVIEVARSVGLQEEIVVNERFHGEGEEGK